MISGLVQMNGVHTLQLLDMHRSIKDKLFFHGINHFRYRSCLFIYFRLLLIMSYQLYSGLSFDCRYLQAGRIMLRSRTKTDDTLRHLYGFPGSDVENLELSNKSPARLWRFGSSRMRTRFVVILFLLIVALGRLRRWRVREDNFFSLVAPYPRSVERTETENQSNSTQGKGDLWTTWNSTWRYPLVDRTTLQELDQLQDLFMDENSSHSSIQWPPRVTRLPEDPSRSRSVDENKRLTKFSNEGICETPTHPQPCRFLFPVRIAEQESKARIHFFQLAKLAMQLNRTLVLPKVGKSKIGACFKWSFQTYYDLDPLNATLTNAPAVVDQEDFQVWLEDLKRHGNPTSRFYSVGPPSVSRSPQDELFSAKDAGIRVYEAEPYDGWRNDLPGCLSKSRWLDGVHPTFMTVAQSTRGGQLNLLSETMVAALSDESMSNRSGPPVTTQILVLDWNLRYPVFPSSYIQQLQYSRNLVALARQLAPSNAYLAVHWRMETIDPSALVGCAHALVDLLVRLLHEELIAHNITTVWFASDYPYPIARRTKTRPRPPIEAKSGTFREFEIRHEEAVQVLRLAFDEGGELDRWKVTDIPEAMESHDVDNELLNDAGVLGILDKLIGIQASIFVSGSNRCARRR